MASSNICWGIEMGFGAIKALKLENESTGMKVLDYAVIQHPKVLSTPELDQTDAMRVALGTLVNQHDMSNARVAVSLPGHQSFARFAKLPPVEPKKVPDIVKFEAVQQIPFPLEEVEWDYQTFVSPDSPDIEVGIFAVTRQRIMEQLSMLGDVGLTPDLVTLSPIAAYNALAVDLGFTDETPGTIILDIGTVATDMIIAEAGRVWVRTFPIGGHQFTEALVSAFKLSYSKAEKLKREAEQSKHARHVFQAMRPVFSDIVQEIQRSIGFYESVHPEANLKRLVGLGSTFRLPGLRKFLKQQLQLDVYRLEQFKKLSVDGPQAGEFQSASFNLATSYGCALQSFDHAPMLANLMPVPVIKTAMWKKKVPYFAAAAGIAAATAGAMFIRPLLDQTALTGAQKPAILSKVANEATQLSNEAADKGVTSDASSNLQGANIVGLLTHRELYSHILEDVASLGSQVSASAREAAELDERLALSFDGNEPFRFMGMTTDYMTTPEEQAGGQPSGRSGRGRGGSNNSRGNDVDPVLQQIGNLRRIKVQAQFEVPLADVSVFMLDHVDSIVRNSLQRDGMPYTIAVTRQEPWEVSGGAAGAVRASADLVTLNGPQQATSAGGTRSLSGIAPLIRPDDVSVSSGRSDPAVSNRDDRSGSRSGGVRAVVNQSQDEDVSRVVLTWYAVLDPMGNNSEEDGDN